MRHLLHQLPLLFILSILCSCANHNKADIATLRSLEVTLTESNKAVSNAASAMLYELEAKTYDPNSHEKAILFYPKAKEIEQLTNNTAAYIETIKSLLKKQAGIDNNDTATGEAWNDIAIVNDLFWRQQRGKDLYKTLQQYRAGILGVDTNLVKEFGNNLVLTTETFDRQSSKDFTTEFLHDIPVAAALCILTKFQTNIYLAGNKTIRYLNYRVASHGDIYTDVYYALVAQSSSCVLPGQYIELTAGVGALSQACKPTVIINGRSILFDVTGVAVTKFRTPQQPGSYSLPVEISYHDQDGKPVTVRKKINYTVFNKDSTAR